MLDTVTKDAARRSHRTLSAAYNTATGPPHSQIVWWSFIAVNCFLISVDKSPTDIRFYPASWQRVLCQSGDPPTYSQESSVLFVCEFCIHVSGLWQFVRLPYKQMSQIYTSCRQSRIYRWSLSTFVAHIKTSLHLKIFGIYYLNNF
jgi:hypothetical protein